MAHEPTSRADAEYCTNQVRAHDRDRYLTSLFAPEGPREDLFALFAFNIEVARVAEMVSEPGLGQIRLQWWREAIDGVYARTPHDHPVVRALTRAVARHQPPRVHFERLIDARAFDLDDGAPDTLDDLVAYAADTSATLTALALHFLGVGLGVGPGVGQGAGREDAAAHRAGRDTAIAWGLTGVLRAHGQGRALLPNQLVTAGGDEGAAQRVAERAAEHLSAARSIQNQVPKRALPALLPAVLAQRHLNRFRRRNLWRATTPLDHLALFLSATLGRY